MSGVLQLPIDLVHVRQVKGKLYIRLFTILWFLYHLPRLSLTTTLCLVFHFTNLAHHPFEKLEGVLFLDRWIFGQISYLFILKVVLQMINILWCGCFVIVVHEIGLLMFILKDFLMEHSLDLQVVEVVDFSLFFVDELDMFFPNGFQNFPKRFISGVLLNQVSIKFRIIHPLYNS